MIELYPAIDILDGSCVRLLHGEREKVTIYGSAVEMAEKWAGLGAKRLHVVDLDGAFSGSFRNAQTVAEIVKRVSVPVQLGGGVRSLEDVERRFDLGVSTVVLGTTAVKKPELVAEAVERYGERVVCGIDARNGRVSVAGWTEQSDLTPLELAKRLAGVGVTTVVYTDISRDGALTGVNAEASIRLQRESGLKVIASGGVAGLADVTVLNRLGVYGVILGKALYTGDIDFSEAVCSASE